MFIQYILIMVSLILIMVSPYPTLSRTSPSAYLPNSMPSFSLESKQSDKPKDQTKQNEGEIMRKHKKFAHVHTTCWAVAF